MPALPEPTTTAREGVPVSPDDIHTEIRRLFPELIYSAPYKNQLSQADVAYLLAHFWPAVEQHFRNLLADEIGATSQRLLDDIPESKRSSRDWDQHEEWLEAASTIRPAAAPTTTTPEEH